MVKLILPKTSVLLFDLIFIIKYSIMNSKTDNFSDNEIIGILDQCRSFREVLGKIGYSSNGSGGYSLLKQQLGKRNIQIPKYHYYGDTKKRSSIPLIEILIENSTYTNRSGLKRRLVNEGLLEYKCKCGNIGLWEGKRLSLQLEHKNGKNNDNRIENLEFLCPNCHSQSETFSGKNNRCSKRVKKIRKSRSSDNFCICGNPIKNRSTHCKDCHHENLRKIKSRPSYGELINDITFSNYTSTGKKYGVSDNTIRKWIKIYEKEMDIHQSF
jgi:Zn finger protein HypA/HybF involved in hydrogenase expression